MLGLPEAILFVTPMGSVTDDRMSDMSQVLSYLVISACCRLDLHQGISRSWISVSAYRDGKVCKWLDICDGLLQTFSIG